MSVTFNQKGYVGMSMSRRAVEAYDNGEMPWSKWSKNAILQQLKYDEYDQRVIDWVSSHNTKDCREALLVNTSYHHTGKYARKTLFYSLSDNYTSLDYLHLLTTEEMLAKSKKRISLAREVHDIIRLNIDIDSITPANTKVWIEYYVWDDYWGIYDTLPFYRGEMTPDIIKALGIPVKGEL